MDSYSFPEDRPAEHTNGRSVIPRRLPPVPSLPSLRTASPASSPSSSPPSSLFSLSPASSSGLSTPGSASPNYSPTKALNVLKRASRPLPQVPSPRYTRSPNSTLPSASNTAQLIVCRSCMNCVTTSESLLPASSVPPGSRAFRGFSGKASLFTDCYNVSTSPPKVQLMTTGAHTMQETNCTKCFTCLGWKIVKAHERSEKWKEGKWLLELENLWLARSSDLLDTSFAKVVERERERDFEQTSERRHQNPPYQKRGSEAGLLSERYPQNTSVMVRDAEEQGLGLEFDTRDNSMDSGKSGYPHSGTHHYSKSTPSFRPYGSASAIHLPVTVVS